MPRLDRTHRWVLSLPIPTVVPTFDLSLIRSPLNYLVPPPAAVNSSSMWVDSATGVLQRQALLCMVPQRERAGSLGQR